MSVFVWTVLVSSICCLQTEIAYIWEINRHGARTPFSDTRGFSQTPGQLTAVGMRQRYLLGKYNRQRLDQYGFMTNNSMLVESTDYYRTIQSAYAEISGF